MCLTVQNLFNNKEIILGREEILEVVKYALENNIVELSFDYTYKNYDAEIDGKVLSDVDYTVRLTGDENEN